MMNIVYNNNPYVIQMMNEARGSKRGNVDDFLKLGTINVFDARTRKWKEIESKEIVRVVNAGMQKIQSEYKFFKRFLALSNIWYLAKWPNNKITDTMATDCGTNLFINANFVYNNCRMDKERVFGILFHESMHNLLEHNRRELKKFGSHTNDRREAQIRNICMDHEVNATMTVDKIVPKTFWQDMNGYYDEKYYGKKWEYVYDHDRQGIEDALQEREDEIRAAQEEMMRQQEERIRREIGDIMEGLRDAIDRMTDPNATPEEINEAIDRVRDQLNGRNNDGENNQGDNQNNNNERRNLGNQNDEETEQRRREAQENAPQSAQSFDGGYIEGWNHAADVIAELGFDEGVKKLKDEGYDVSTWEERHTANENIFSMFDKLINEASANNSNEEDNYQTREQGMLRGIQEVINQLDPNNPRNRRGSQDADGEGQDDDSSSVRMPHDSGANDDDDERPELNSSIDPDDLNDLDRSDLPNQEGEQQESEDGQDSQDGQDGDQQGNQNGDQGDQDGQNGGQDGDQEGNQPGEDGQEGEQGGEGQDGERREGNGQDGGSNSEGQGQRGNGDGNSGEGGRNRRNQGNGGQQESQDGRPSDDNTLRSQGSSNGARGGSNGQQSDTTGQQGQPGQGEQQGENSREPNSMNPMENMNNLLDEIGQRDGVSDQTRDTLDRLRRELQSSLGNDNNERSERANNLDDDTVESILDRTDELEDDFGGDMQNQAEQNAPDLNDNIDTNPPGSIVNPDEETFRDAMEEEGYDSDSVDNMNRGGDGLTGNNGSAGNNPGDISLEEIRNEAIREMEARNENSLLALACEAVDDENEVDSEIWDKVLELFLKSRTLNLGGTVAMGKGNTTWGHKNHLWRGAVMPKANQRKYDPQTVNILIDTFVIDSRLNLAFLTKAVALIKKLEFSGFRLTAFGAEMGKNGTLDVPYEEIVSIEDTIERCTKHLNESRAGIGVDNFEAAAKFIHEVSLQEPDSVFIIIGDGIWEYYGGSRNPKGPSKMKAICPDMLDSILFCIFFTNGYDNLLKKNINFMKNNESCKFKHINACHANNLINRR